MASSSSVEPVLLPDFLRFSALVSEDTASSEAPTSVPWKLNPAPAQDLALISWIYPAGLCSGPGQSCFRLLQSDYAAALALLSAWNYTPLVRLSSTLPAHTRLLVLGLDGTPQAVVMGRLLPGRFQVWMLAHEPGLAEVWRQQLLLKLCCQAAGMGVSQLEIVARADERLPLASRATHRGRATICDQ